MNTSIGPIIPFFQGLTLAQIQTSLMCLPESYTVVVKPKVTGKDVVSKYLESFRKNMQMHVNKGSLSGYPVYEARGTD